jgi:hypothetical protein
MDHESEITPIRDGELGLEKLTRISRLARGRCIAAGPPNVRYAPESDRLLRCQQMTRWAMSDQSASQKNAFNSVTSSAPAKSDQSLFDHLVSDAE